MSSKIERTFAFFLDIPLSALYPNKRMVKNRGVFQGMKLLVCVKQVPDSEKRIVINREGSWIANKDKSVFRMNRFDEFALEEALLIRDHISHEQPIWVHAVSVGPPRVTLTLKKAMAMGADEGTHILVDDDRYMSPFDTASLIASYAKDKGYDMILTGVMAEDDMHCLVGQFVAEHLGYPFATAIIHQEIMDGRSKISVERAIESGRTECLRLNLPAVLTIQSGINTPRYPSLSNVIRAKDQKIISIDAEKLKTPEKREELMSLAYPEPSSKGQFIEGTQVEKAQKLLRILHEKSFI
jgi:electron transfer flavoprotein beta subunit